MAVDTHTILDRHASTDSVSLRDYVDARWDSLNAQSAARHDSAINEVRRLDEALEMADAHYKSLRDAQNSAAKIFADKIDTQFKSVQDNIALAKDAIQIQFISISKGTDTATTALDKRLEGMNEFRSQMNDMSVKFITRDDVETTTKYLNDRISALERMIGNLITRQEMETQNQASGERLSSLEKFSNNMQGRMWVIAAVVVVMEVALKFLGH